MVPPPGPRLRARGVGSGLPLPNRIREAMPSVRQSSTKKRKRGAEQYGLRREESDVAERLIVDARFAWWWWSITGETHEFLSVRQRCAVDAIQVVSIYTF